VITNTEMTSIKSIMRHRGLRTLPRFKLHPYIHTPLAAAEARDYVTVCGIPLIPESGRHAG